MQGELAQEILKRIYDLGFVSLPDRYDEEALKEVPEQHMTRRTDSRAGRDIRR